VTAAQKIKKEILLHAITEDLLCYRIDPTGITADTVDELYLGTCEKDAETIKEIESNFRASYAEETGLESPLSTNYESKAVAMELDDGSWVGWTFWYGGGKYGTPEKLPWLEDAYYLDVVEKQTVVMIFTRKD